MAAETLSLDVTRPGKARGRVVDLFCGAGGASIGFENAGFDVVAAVDNDSDAVEAYQENLGLRPLEADLRKTSYDEILDHFDLDRDDVDVLAGCPPCQSFSSLRDTTPWPEDKERDELLHTYLDIVRDACAPLLVFENVPGILNKDGGDHVDLLLEVLRDIGYGVAWDVVRAERYGVPQRRRRIIAFGVLGADDEHLDFPEPTHASPEKARENGKVAWTTVGDAIGDLPALKAGESDDAHQRHEARNHLSDTVDFIASIPEDGGSYRDLPKNEWLDCHRRLDDEGKTGAGSIYGRMSWDEPAPTLTTRCTSPSTGRFVHPEQHRGITPREAARLQTFPFDYELPEETSVAERLIGNAVPPVLIQHLVPGFLGIERNREAFQRASRKS